MSKVGRVKVGEASSVNTSVPHSTVARRERSRRLAQTRRDTYKSIMDELTHVLPFPNEAIAQLDYNTRLRLALCFFQMKTIVGTEGEATSLATGRGAQKNYGRAKQIVKRKQVTKSKPKYFHPGMLQDLMSEALDGFMVVIQMDGTIVFLSEGVHKHLGLFQSEYIGLTIFDLILEEDHDDVRKKMSEAEAKSLTRTTKLGAMTISFFCRMKCSRGKVANTITRSPGYKLVYVTGTLKVSKEEPYIACIVHPVSPPSILELRMEGNMFVTHYSMDMTCLFFDGRLRQLLGYSKQELVGNTPFHLHHHEDTEATLQCSRGVMARGEGLSGYYRFLSHFGDYVWLQTRATLMYDSRSGQPSYIVCMNFIISKEEGDKDFELKKAITSDDSNIKSDSDHAHHPFPLSEREDGIVVNPLQSDEVSQSRTTDDSAAMSSSHKREEPSSTVDGISSSTPTEEEETITLVDDCVSSDSAATPESSSIPSVIDSSQPSDSSPEINSKSNRSPTESQSHSYSKSSTSSGSVSSISSSTLSQTSPKAKKLSQQSSQSADIVAETSCQPDSTTSRSCSQSENQTKNSTCTGPTRGTSGDLGYHSVSSRGSGVTASIGNESEISGSFHQRSSPESSLYTPFSPEYPQSVFSSDSSLPPPSNRTLLHVIEQPLSITNTQPPLHHHQPSVQSAQVMTPFPQQAQSVYQIPVDDRYCGFTSNQGTPNRQHFVQHDGQFSHDHHFFVSGVVTDSSQLKPQLGHGHVSAEGGYGGYHASKHLLPSFPMSNGSSSSYLGDGGTPANILHDWNPNEIRTTFVKQEPSTSPPYVPPQGTAAMFNNPQVLGDQRFKHNGSSPHLMTRTIFSVQQQPSHHSMFTSGSNMFPGNNTGLPSTYHYGGGQVATSNLPQLTGEDLKMLDVFSDQFHEEEPFVRVQSQPASLNCHGSSMM